MGGCKVLCKYKPLSVIMVIKTVSVIIVVKTIETFTKPREAMGLGFTEVVASRVTQGEMSIIYKSRLCWFHRKDLLVLPLTKTLRHFCLETL